ncbi:MAG TPA: sugar phosphate isomerase/epimerase family protein, partial [Anaerolineae bacterium]
MRFGCCVGTREQIEILAHAGFDFCELPAAAVQPFETDADAAPALRALESAPLRPESFNVLVPASLPLAGPKVDHAALAHYLRRAFSRMVGLGGQVVVLGSGGARRIPAGYPRETGLSQIEQGLTIALEEANRAGITLALEHLNRAETNTFNSIAESRDMLMNSHLARHGMRLLADLYHIEKEHETLDVIATVGPLLAHVHVAGGERRSPDVSGYDYAGFMQSLHHIGYDQRISAECSWENLSA